jgi:hypothetical protein
MANGRKTGGRQKGVPNKVTGELKDMILGALADAGGRKYLSDLALSNPNAFTTLVGKVLPMTVQGPGEKGEHAIVYGWQD